MPTDRIDEQIVQMLDAAAPDPGRQAREKTVSAMVACLKPQEEQAVGGRPARRTKYLSTRGERRMKRFVFAGLALLVVAIGAAVMIPGRGHKTDARTILIAAAQAMEEARTVYLAGHGSEAAKGSPSGLRLNPQRFEFWLGSRKAIMRVAAPGGKVSVVTVLDADRLEWCVYDAEKKTAVMADLTPIAKRVGEVLSGVTEMLSSLADPGRIRKELAVAYPDARESATTEMRGGRKLIIVTAIATIKEAPHRVTSRWVFEVDPENKHLLTLRQYARAEGSPEKLISDVDTIKYDVPFPPDSQEMKLPEGTKTMQATVSLKESKTMLTLTMANAEDKHIGEMSIQKSKRQLRTESGR